jgi:hypothetical protein
MAKHILRAVLAVSVIAGTLSPRVAVAEGNLDHCFWTAWACGCASWGSCSGERCPGSGYCGDPI